MYVIASVPEVVIGEPEILKPVGTVAATLETVAPLAPKPKVEVATHWVTEPVVFNTMPLVPALPALSYTLPKNVCAVVDARAMVERPVKVGAAILGDALKTKTPPTPVSSVIDEPRSAESAVVVARLDASVKSARLAV